MTIYHFLAFVAGAACMYAYQAYKETKDAAGLTLDKQIDPAGYGGPGPVDPK